MQYIIDEKLAYNIEHCAKRIEKGFFNVFLIWGPTRCGKSTLAFQMAKELSLLLNVDFSDKDVFFSAEKITQEGIKGHRKKIYVLDEASFDGKGVDWQSKDQQNFLKMFNVAAKFNQTYFILLPHIEELKYNFVRDAHSMGLQVTYDADTLERGFFRMYDKNSLIYKWSMLSQKKLTEAEQAYFSHEGRFGNDLSFFNEEAYNKAKDEAIAELGKENKKEPQEKPRILADRFKKRLKDLVVYVYDKYKVPKRELIEISDTDKVTLNDWLREANVNA